MTTGIQVRDTNDLARIADMAHKSGLAKVSSAAAAGVIIMTGMELGLTPMQALLGIHLVEGRPVLAADTLVAIVRRSPVCAMWRTVESTEARCTIETQRKGADDVVTRTWTADDAKRAGLWTKNIWQKYPRAMLRHRAAADLAREVYPDVVLGMYDPEELDADDVAAADVGSAADEPRAVTAPALPAQTEAPPAYPAWQAFAADLETVTDIKSARACWEMHNAALQREADAEHQRGGELVVDKLTALGYEMTAAHGRAAIGGTLDAHLIEVYEGLVRVGRREGDDDFALAVADVVAVLRAHRDAPESVRKDAAAAGSRTLQSLGMTAADARAALTAALKPPPPPDGTNAPAAGTRGATTARGEGRTTAADTTAPAASEVRVERDDDPDGERARAFAWLTHIAACKSPEHVAGSLRKRAQEFRAQGVFAARRAAVVDEMARRLDGDRVRAEALLCGVLAGIREAA